VVGEIRKLDQQKMTRSTDKSKNNKGQKKADPAAKKKFLKEGLKREKKTSRERMVVDDSVNSQTRKKWRKTTSSTKGD